MAFPCCVCNTPTAQSADPDRWVCEICNASNESNYLPRDDVVTVLAQMAVDPRLTNEEVKRAFASAVHYLITGPSGGEGAAAPELGPKPNGPEVLLVMGDGDEETHYQFSVGDTVERACVVAETYLKHGHNKATISIKHKGTADYE